VCGFAAREIGTVSFTSVLLSADEPRALLAECKARLAPQRGQHNFGVVYLSDHLAADATGIAEGLRLITGVEHWVGGVALGVMGSEGEIFDRPAISLLLGTLPQGAFRVFGPLENLREDPHLAGWCRQHAPYLGLVHADPRRANAPALIEQLGRDGALYVLGGLLSSRGAYPQFGVQVGESAVSGALFTDAVPVMTRLTQGCTPIGPRRRVSAANGMQLLALDGQPALRALAQDLEADGGGAADVHVALPRAGSDTGDYLVRNLMGLGARAESLVVGQELSVGDTLMFCRRDARSARRDLERMLDDIAGALKAPPQAGLYVSCLARGPNLFSEPGLETRLIRERLGEFPLTGFFANGEVAGGRLYGYTGVLTLLL
jgi:small ligand-binding sensory domain FIST